MKRLNFALAGCGRIGTRHAEHISRIATLKAVCDNVNQKADDFAGKFGAKAYYSIEDLLEKENDIDVLSVCTPNGLHAGHTIMALKKGLHVLCEKPMAISVYDCGEMIKEAERANRRLFIVKQNRYNPPVQAVRQLLEEKKLGMIQSVQLNCFWNRSSSYYTQSDWKGKLALDGGTLYTQFSHFIDLLYWLFGDVRRVEAITRNYAHRDIIEFEDSGVVLLEFYSGIIGTVNFNVNCYSRNMEGSLAIFGETGTVKIGGQYLNELEYQDIKDYRIENLPAGNPPNNYGMYTGSMSNHDKVYENVIEVLLNQGTIATNGYEGLKTVEIIDKIYSAARRNSL